MMKKSISITYNIMFNMSEYLKVLIGISSNISGFDGSGPAEVAPLVYQSVFVLILKRGL